LAEEALHHIERALRRYLPHEPYAFSLGGGLDSGGMWSILGKWSREGNSSLQQAQAFSMIHPGMSCNEEDMIRQHMDLNPGNYRLLDASSLVPSMYRSRMLADLDHIPTSSAYQAFWFAEHIQSDFTHRHEINGIGGDELFGGTLDYLADELLAGHVTTVLQDLFTLKMPGNRSRYQIIRNHLIKPCSHRLGLHPGPWRKPAWLGTRFTKIHKVIEARASTPRLVTRAQEVLAGTVEQHQAGMTLEPREQLFAMFGIASRSPLLDRDLIEFAQALPPRACWQGRQYKTLLRDAIQPMAPKALTERTAKTFFNEPYARDRVQLDADLHNLEAWQLVEKGILDLEGIRHLIASHRLNKGRIRNVDFIHRLLLSEFFCNSLQS
jgi:asparagine synthetase B (glutamine-hydrolysing)